MPSSKHPCLPPEEERRTQIALFRYGLIAALLHHPLERGAIGAHLAAIAAQPHQIPFSTRTTVDAETAWRYLAWYRKGGFEALKPKPRGDLGQSRRIPAMLVEQAIALREEVPTRSAATIIQILRRDPAFPADLTIAPRTLRGLLYRRGKTRAKLQGETKAFRRFEREHANDLWQGDMLVGPYLPDAERPGKFRRTAGCPLGPASSTTMRGWFPMASSSSRNRCPAWNASSSWRFSAAASPSGSTSTTARCMSPPNWPRPARPWAFGRFTPRPTPPTPKASGCPLGALLWHRA